MPDKYAVACQKLLLDKYDLQSKIERYNPIGWNAHYLVLKNIETGKPKRTHMEITEGVQKKLPWVDADKLIKKWNKEYPDKKQTDKK